jgi:predicted DNA-binding antitoxin AbrB/MazE fold protein
LALNQLDLTEGDNAKIDLTEGDSAKIDLAEGDNAKIDLTEGDNAKIDLTKVSQLSWSEQLRQCAIKCVNRQPVKVLFFAK